jgi:Carboxypeptidase regulatory-like domain
MKRRAKNFGRGLMSFASQIPVLLLILLLSIGGQTARASVTATISGVVRDPSGAVIAGAQVVARNHETGAAVTVLTDAQGFYSLQGLPVDTYDVEINKGGFKRSVQSGLGSL